MAALVFYNPPILTPTVGQTLQARGSPDEELCSSDEMDNVSCSGGWLTPAKSLNLYVVQGIKDVERYVY